ncbi:zinc finger protein 23-like [Ptychodera flava]|uniref:zinc finger protein 23-like n=1 Tax=Ptychodera flava TaxID=63121 RepID=UPI00396A86C5
MSGTHNKVSIQSISKFGGEVDEVCNTSCSERKKTMIKRLQEKNAELLNKWKDDTLTSEDKTEILNFLVQTGTILVKTETGDNLEGKDYNEIADGSAETTVKKESSGMPAEREPSSGLCDRSDPPGHSKIANGEASEMSVKIGGDQRTGICCASEFSFNDIANRSGQPVLIPSFRRSSDTSCNLRDAQKQKQKRKLNITFNDDMIPTNSHALTNQDDSCDKSENRDREIVPPRDGMKAISITSQPTNSPVQKVLPPGGVSFNGNTNNSAENNGAVPLSYQAQQPPVCMPLMNSPIIATFIMAGPQTNSNIGVNIQQSNTVGIPCDPLVVTGSTPGLNYPLPSQQHIVPVLVGNQIVPVALNSLPLLNPQSQAVHTKLNVPGPVGIPLPPQPWQMLPQHIAGFQLGVPGPSLTQGLSTRTIEDKGTSSHKELQQDTEISPSSQMSTKENGDGVNNQEKEPDLGASMESKEIVTSFENKYNITIVTEETIAKPQDFENNLVDRASKKTDTSQNLKENETILNDSEKADQVMSALIADVFIDHVSPDRLVYAIERSLPAEGLECAVEHCGETFLSRQALACHVTKRHTISKYQCEICHGDIEHSELSKHMNGHAKCDKRYTAGVYDRSVSEKEIRVMRLHGNVEHFSLVGAFLPPEWFDSSLPEDVLSPKPCNCGHVISNLAYFVSHCMSKHPDSVFKCKVCGETVSFSTLFEHMKQHKDVKSYKCDVCNHLFPSQHKFWSHRKMHVKHKMFQCQECDNVFASNYVLKCHMRKHTGIYPVYCDICGKGFHKQHQLKRHKPTHSTEKAYKCEICNTRVKNAESVRRHMKIHTGDRPFPCEICGKNFITKGAVRKHMLVHSDVRPFLCEECGSTFQTNLRLKQHLRSHTGIKPFKCEECDKVFAWKTDLTRHMDSHSGRKEYMCDLCGKTYRRPEALRIHQRLHTDERPYKCDNCGKGFNQKVQLQLHERNGTCLSQKPSGKCKNFARKEALA